MTNNILTNHHQLLALHFYALIKYKLKTSKNGVTDKLIASVKYEIHLPGCMQLEWSLPLLAQTSSNFYSNTKCSFKKKDMEN